jgi:DNA-binding NarL/FixJ family response regulator
LTAREIEVVALVVDGLTNPEIGVRLHISSRTVQSHVAAAMRKLGARSRTQLAVMALRSGVVPLQPGE